eukprot:CAMPEP_0182418942 /NCGR_PEP_ID=MMETSP1167-20130531/3325_1 /TAXON_ID=2988 /ORGANISM="Mallomonas Sp, Strain CCMP3275" /LENGTH=242 /DNA_ID=CAMNT_0024593441 /DNA_START=68 /DNA_END=796 /DNA_ORIENTATION=+
MSVEKHDVFVGNLSYTTTEDQLREIFSPVGPIAGIRIVSDRDTGRPRGFAFVEYLDAPTALSAIRNLDGHELNNRKLRVSYSNNSNLKDIARSMGQPVQDSYQSGSRTVETIITGMKLTEIHDILDGMKSLIDEDRGQRARALLEAYPQLVPALIEMQKRLGMVEANGSVGGGGRQSHSHRSSSPTSQSSRNKSAGKETHPSQQLLLKQLLQVSDEDLNRLPVDKRNQLLALREQLGGNNTR